jgi:hypothetical protein
MNVDQKELLRVADIQVLQAALVVTDRALDEFIGSCMDENEKPKAPDMRALMKARAMLPPSRKHSLKKT